MTLNSECGIRNAESRVSVADGVRTSQTHSALCTPHSEQAHPELARPERRARRTGFTLIELLVAIAIIAILAGLLLGVAARAAERGREARTKAMVSRIHTLLMQQYDTYKDRRAPIRDSLKGKRSKAQAQLRLFALRELMLMEMPDRWSDVLLAAVDNVSSANNIPPPQFLQSTSSSSFGGPTPLIEAYRRQYFAMLGAGVSKDVIKTNQGAECLYMVVMLATADGEARSLFNESSIGDTDGDGAYEFLDGWGNPISWIRWPAGYESDLQLNARQLGGDPTSSVWLQAAAGDHDPFDMFRVDQAAFRTVPLIFSPGSDGRYDLYTARDTTVWPSSTSTVLLPYAPVTSVEGDFFLGSPMNEAGTDVDLNGGADNITNHNIAAK